MCANAEPKRIQYVDHQSIAITLRNIAARMSENCARTLREEADKYDPPKQPDYRCPHCGKDLPFVGIKT